MAEGDGAFHLFLEVTGENFRINSIIEAGFYCDRADGRSFLDINDAFSFFK